MTDSKHIFSSSSKVWPETSDLGQLRSGMVHLALDTVLEGSDSIHFENGLDHHQDEQHVGDTGLESCLVQTAYTLIQSESQLSSELGQQAYGSIQQNNSLIQQAFDAAQPDMGLVQQDYMSIQQTNNSLPQSFCGTVSLANSSAQQVFEPTQPESISVSGSSQVQQNFSIVPTTECGALQSFSSLQSPNINLGCNSGHTYSSTGAQSFDPAQAPNGSVRQIYDSIQLDNGSGQHLPASVQQGFGSIQQGDGLVQPGFGSIQKANLSVQLSYSTVQPGNTLVQPGFGPVQQGGSSVQLSYRAVKPTGQPTGSTVQQGYSVVQPARGSVQHSYSMVQPTGSIQQGYGLIQPSPSVVQPGYSSIKLSNNSVQQGYGLVQPANGSVHPGYNSIQLGNGSVQQGYGLVQSANGSVKQGYGVLQSSNCPVKQAYTSAPEYGSVQPTNGSVQGNYGTLRQNNGSSQQGYDLVQNDNGSLQLCYDTVLSYNSPQPNFPNHPASSMYYTMPLGHQGAVGRQVINGSVVPMQELNNNSLMISTDGLVHGPEDVQQMMYGVLKYPTDSPAPPSKSSRPRKCSAVERPYVKKPQNAFMLFMKEQRPLVMEEHKIRNSANVNAILGQKWKSLSKQEQSQYFEQANSVRRHHEQEHPEWSYRDNYGQKRKRDRRKKIDLDNNSAAPALKPKEDQALKESSTVPVHSIRTDILAEQYQKYSACVKPEPATPAVAEVHYLSLSEEKMLLDMLENFESNTDKSVTDKSEQAPCSLATINKSDEDPVKRQSSTETDKFSEDELLLQMLEDPYWAYKKGSSSTQEPAEETNEEATTEPNMSAKEVVLPCVGGVQGHSAPDMETMS